MRSIKDFLEDQLIWNTIFFALGTLFFLGLLSEDFKDIMFMISFLISVVAGFLSSFFNSKRAVSALILYLLGHAGGAALMTIFKFLEGDQSDLSLFLSILKNTALISLLLALLPATVWLVGLPLSYFVSKKFISKNYSSHRHDRLKSDAGIFCVADS